MLGAIVEIIAVLISGFSANAQEPRLRVKYVPGDTIRDIPQDVKDLINRAVKKTVFEVVGLTEFSDQVLKTDKLIFQPGSTLILSGLRSGDSLIVIAGEVFLQEATSVNHIIRTQSFTATPDHPEGMVQEVSPTILRPM